MADLTKEEMEALPVHMLKERTAAGMTAGCGATGTIVPDKAAIRTTVWGPAVTCRFCKRLAGVRGRPSAASDASDTVGA